MTERSAYRPTDRFTSKAETYAKYRPGYPRCLLKELKSRGALRNSDVVADVGSGTGLLSIIFLENGHRVYGIEPNGAMRAVAERRFNDKGNFVSIDARAEATTLPEGSIDLIVVGQAFHWFELGPTKDEFLRILRKGRSIAMIWNERQEGSEGFLAEYDKLLDRHCEQNGPMGRVNVDEKALREFFSPGPMVKFTLPNWQDVDLDGAIGRLTSSSYAPNPGQPGYKEIVADLTDVFHRYEKDGRVRFDYDTEVYLGSFDR